MLMRIRGINYYVEDSLAVGEPLILLHGFTGSTQNWQPIVSEFAHARVILIDLIGHGQTDSPNESSRYKMEEVVEDIIEILDKLKLEKVNVLGYSMGGRVALSLAAMYPHRLDRLILESSSPGLEGIEERNARKQADERLAIKILNEGIESFVYKWEQIPLFETQKQLPLEQRELIRKQRLQNNPIGLANSLISMGTGAQPSWWEYLSALSFPVLLLCGEYDRKFCSIAKRMGKCLPISEVKEINAAGHAIHVEQPRIFGKIVSEFLKKTNF